MLSISRFSPRRWVSGVVRGMLAASLLMLLAGPAPAAPTAAQRAEIGAIGTLMTKAGNLFKENKFAESAEVVKEAQSRLEKLAAEADQVTLGQLVTIQKRLTNAHALLELEGLTLPELKPLESMARDPAAGPTGGDAAGGISFVKQVAPILTARCGGCHVRNARGMFSMASYETLMAGPPAGKVVFAGNVPGSDLVVKIEDKEMPPNGSGIPAAELETLKAWVAAGAKFDGPDPKARLDALAGGAAPVAAMQTSVQKPTGKETVSFALDIAPILAESCTGCHGATRPRENFSLLTFEGLLRGGDRGEPILPGKPADSLLVKKLHGTADGARMPMNRPPLDSAVIAKIEKWIEEGAKFDGPDAKQSIVEIAALAKAESQTHEELSADRAILATANWRLGMPGNEPSRAESKNFLVLGSVGENTLADIAQRAETQAAEVAKILKSPESDPLVKGRMTLFVFGERYDYGEFGKMVEKRDLPNAWRGHHRYSIVDAYGAVLSPKASAYSLDTLVAQQLAAVHVASLGRGVPRWFAEGTGRVVASRLATGDDERVAQWDSVLPQVLAGMSAPEDFLSGKLPPEEADIASYSYVKYLMADPRKYNLLLEKLRGGGEFAAAFREVWNAPPEQLAGAWIRKPPKAGPRRPAKG
jgi:mono/diheme cytochrome c family protein